MQTPYPTAELYQNRGYDPASIPAWSHKVSDLVSRIKKEFENPQRPLVTFHVARAYDDEWVVSNDRGYELRALDTELHWQDISDSSIETFSEYFTFSDSDGWKFYIPAFMLHSIRCFPSTSYDVAYVACHSLRSVETFTEDQITVLKDFAALWKQVEQEEEGRSWKEFADNQSTL